MSKMRCPLKECKEGKEKGRCGSGETFSVIAYALDDLTLKVQLRMHSTEAVLHDVYISKS
jgi:hypothetical protein